MIHRRTVIAAIVALLNLPLIATAQTPGAVFKIPLVPVETGEIIVLPSDGVGALDQDGQESPPSDAPIGIKDGEIRPELIGPAVPATEYRFVAAIYYENLAGKPRICTGTLLSHDTLLTAGHCGCGRPESYVVGFNQDARSGPGYRIKGAPILFDARVCRDGILGQGRDLALLRLAQRVEKEIPPGFGYPTQSVWDLRSAFPPGSRLTAVGYGFTNSGTTGVRMKVAIGVFSAACEERSVWAFCAPFREMVLADGPGTENRADTCGGDSGGPVFLALGATNILVAVTSRGAPFAHVDASRHCGGGGIYSLIGRRSVQAWFEANGVPPASVPAVTE